MIRTYLFVLFSVFSLLFSGHGTAQTYVQDEKVQDLIEKIEYFTGRDNEKALSLTTKIIDYGEEKSDRHLLGIANIRRAIIYDISRNNKYAYIHFQRGIEFLKKENDPKELAYAYNNFGIHYYNQKEWNEAMRYYDLAVIEYQSIDDFKSVNNTRINKANIHTILKNYDKALGIYQSCLKYYTAYYDSTFQLTLNTNIAYLHYDQDNVDSAFQYAQVALDHLSNKMEHETKADVYILMAKCHNKRKEYKKGLNFGKLAYDLALKYNLPQSNIEASKVLSDSYEGLGDNKQALLYQKEFFNLNDSLFYQNKKNEISEIRSKYQEKLARDKEVMESRIEIKKLEQEYIVLQKEHQSHKQREFYIITVLVLVSVMILSMIIFSWNKIRTNKELRNKNEIIENALNEKNLLIKEVHHRVKNNLQLIVSMMELDSMNVNNPEAQRKIRDTIGRVQSIGIIHQRLHEQEKVTEIDSSTYFENLFSEILKTSNKKVNFNTHIEDFYLNIDEGISFGLILNEMITNSIKYVEEKEILINIEFSRKNDNLIMSYSDNGHVISNENVKGTGFGMKLIKIMSRKLKGHLETTRIQGIEYKLTIENYFG